MTRREIMRRAGEYRHQAEQLKTRAAGVRDQADRRHMLDLAETYQRTADNMAPEPAASEAQSVFKLR